MQYVYASIVLIVLILLFVFSFLANKKTPRPEGCEDLNAECSSCPITSCLSNKSHGNN